MAGVTQGLVLDCSITIPWYLEDEPNPLAEKVLKLLGHTALWIPAIWHLEFTNALLIAERRKRIDAVKRVKILEQVERLPLSTDTTLVSMRGINELATAHQLTSYDTAYLELAIRRGLRLATLDQSLITAARKLKHPLLS